MLNRRTLLALSAAGAVLLSASAQAQQPPVKIAAIVPISGAGAFDGQLALEGILVGGVAADSLGPAEVGSTAFELASAHGVDVPLISDEDIVAARRWLWQRCRILAEPGASVALASLLTGAVKVHPGDTVVVVISGGNDPTIP